MDRLIVRHLTGWRAPWEQTFPLADVTRLRIGRHPACDIRFDAARDDVVGRLHAQIERTGPASPRFTLVDLDSRNGTFLNRRRVTAPAPLTHGDVIEFGVGGPQIEFRIDTEDQ